MDLLVGFNFVPSTAVNSTDLWQRETFDRATIARELGWTSGAGFNSFRVFIQHAVWEADPNGLKDRFEDVLDIANWHRLSVMPVLFGRLCLLEEASIVG